MADLAALRAALDGVVTKTTWRPDGTMLLHDAEAWTTLVGRIVMLTNGDWEVQRAANVRVAAPPSEDAAPLRPGVCECGPVCAACGRLRVAGDAELREAARAVVDWADDRTHHRRPPRRRKGARP